MKNVTNIKGIKDVKNKQKEGVGIKHINVVYHHKNREDMLEEVHNALLENDSLYTASGNCNKYGSFIEICSIDDSSCGLRMIDEEDNLSYEFLFHHYFVSHNDLDFYGMSMSLNANEVDGTEEELKEIQQQIDSTTMNELFFGMIDKTT